VLNDNVLRLPTGTSEDSSRDVVSYGTSLRHGVRVAEVTQNYVQHVRRPVMAQANDLSILRPLAMNASVVVLSHD